MRQVRPIITWPSRKQNGRKTVLELLDEIVKRADLSEALAVCTVVRTRALGRLQLGKSALFHFTLDHDLGWDDGLVCSGTMDVAVQILQKPADAKAYDDARQVLAAGRDAAIRVAVPDESGRLITFERTLEPKPTLIIAGAGHVGAALARMGLELGFQVTLIDNRSDFVSTDRFPGTTCIVGEIETKLGHFEITEHTYVVIVTRGHRHDGRALGTVVGSNARYIGLIGSKRKIITILRDLHHQGVPRAQLEKIHAPIGLDIGATTPAEIAVSIAAELIAVRRRASDRPAASMCLTSDLLDRALRRE